MLFVDMWKKEEEAGKEDDYIPTGAGARFEFVCMYAIHWGSKLKFMCL